MSSPLLAAERVAQCKSGDLLASVALPAASMTQLAFYCAASGVTDPIHYDREFARRAGFADAVVNGSLRVAWMAQVLSELVEPAGLLRRLACSHRGMMLVGEAPLVEVRYQSHERQPGGGQHLDVRIEVTVGGELRDSGEASLYVAAS